MPSHPRKRNDVLCYSMSHVLVCLIVLVSCAFDASAGFLAAGNGQNRAFHLDFVSLDGGILRTPQFLLTDHRAGRCKHAAWESWAGTLEAS